MKKEIIVEKWESFREFRGKLFKIDLEKLAEEYEDPSLLEMDEDELSDWLEESMIDLEDGYDSIENYVSVVNESDPDLETNYFMNKKDAFDGISWRGFWRGSPDDWTNMSHETKNKKIDDLKEELEKDTQQNSIPK